jgi:hypothetical protein
VLNERGNVAGLKFGSVHTPHIDNWTTAEEWMGGGSKDIPNQSQTILLHRFSFFLILRLGERKRRQKQK